MLHSIAFVLSCVVPGARGVTATTPRPGAHVDWDYHTPRFRPLFSSFERERAFAPVASFDWDDRRVDRSRAFRIETFPTILRAGLTAELTVRDDGRGLVVRATRVAERALAEYLYLSVLVLIMDRTPSPKRVLIALPWTDPERQAVFRASAGEWDRGWRDGDLGRALARFGFALAATDESGRAIFELDSCGAVLGAGE